MIEELQSKGRGTFVTLASKLISMFLGGEVMMVLVYIISFAIAKPSRSLYYLLMIFFNIYLTIVVKLILHNPRPYMVVDK